MVVSPETVGEIVEDTSADRLVGSSGCGGSSLEGKLGKGSPWWLMRTWESEEREEKSNSRSIDPECQESTEIFQNPTRISLSSGSDKFSSASVPTLPQTDDDGSS
ncbi:unnamed protein product [Sphagnum tenellum]